jgi:hypothetical protein
MKVQIRRFYLAKDGTEFTSVKECEKYEKVHLTKSDIDFMKDVFSAFLTQTETVVQHLKDEAKVLKEVNPLYSDMCYSDIKKVKLKITKLSELQRKIKRMR